MIEFTKYLIVFLLIIIFFGVGFLTHYIIEVMNDYRKAQIQETMRKRKHKQKEKDNEPR